MEKPMSAEKRYTLLVENDLAGKTEEEVKAELRFIAELAERVQFRMIHGYDPRPATNSKEGPKDVEKPLEKPASKEKRYTLLVENDLAGKTEEEVKEELRFMSEIAERVQRRLRPNFDFPSRMTSKEPAEGEREPNEP